MEGMKEGMEKGLEKGKAEGIETNKRDNARNLKQLGVSLDIISQATGLTLEEIEAL